MAKGDCKRRTMKIVRIFVKTLAPPVVRFIADTVGLLQSTDWSNHEKRAVAIELAKAKMAQRGEEAKEGAIRAAIEISVGALKQGGDALSQLGDAADDDRDLLGLAAEELDLAGGEA